MLEWFSRNQEVILWVVRGVFALALLVFKFYVDHNKNVQEALAAFLQLVRGEISEVLTGPNAREAVRLVSDAVYDSYLSGTIVAMFLSKSAFFDLALKAWNMLATTSTDAKAGLIRAGFSVKLD